MTTLHFAFVVLSAVRGHVHARMSSHDTQHNQAGTCADQPGKVVQVDKKPSDAAQQEWAERNWTCSDWAGYTCSLGGWGVDIGGAGHAVRKSCPASCYDGACSQHQAVATPSCTFVFGLESSGTRFVARGLSRLLNRHTTWDGQSPPCWSYTGHSIQHISLPHGVACSDRDAEEGIVIEANADVCAVPPGGDAPPPLLVPPPPSPAPRDAGTLPFDLLPSKRWMANLTSTLLARPECKAVVVTRASIFQRLSKLSGHGCGARVPEGEVWDESTQYLKHVAWRREDALARRFISEALHHFKWGSAATAAANAHAPASRLLVVPYEDLEWLGAYHWDRIGRFVIGRGPEADARLRTFQPPAFASGDGRWLTPAELPDLMRMATPASAEWNESAWALRVAAAKRAQAQLQTPSPSSGSGSGSSSSSSSTTTTTGSSSPSPSRLEGGIMWSSLQRLSESLRALSAWLADEVAATQPDGTPVVAAATSRSPWHEATYAAVEAPGEWAYLSAEARARWEQRRLAVQRRAAVLLSPRQCAVLGVAIGLLLLLLCVAPMPMHRKVERRLRTLSRTLTVDAGAGPHPHLGVTLGPHALVGVACTRVVRLCQADLLYAAGMRHADVLVEVDGAAVTDHEHGLRGLETALARHRRASRHATAFQVRVVSASQARECERELSLLRGPRWMVLWRWLFVSRCSCRASESKAGDCCGSTSAASALFGGGEGQHHHASEVWTASGPGTSSVPGREREKVV